MRLFGLTLPRPVEYIECCASRCTGIVGLYYWRGPHNLPTVGAAFGFFNVELRFGVPF